MRLLTTLSLSLLLAACGADAAITVEAGTEATGNRAADPAPVVMKSVCDILTIADIQTMVPCLTEDLLQTVTDDDRMSCIGRCTIDVNDVENTNGSFIGKITYYEKTLATPIDENYLNKVTHKVEIPGTTAAYYSTIDGLSARTDRQVIVIQAVHMGSPGGIEGNEAAIIAAANKVIAAL